MIFLLLLTHTHTHLVLANLLSMLICTRCVKRFAGIFLVLYTYIARKIIAAQIAVLLEPPLYFDIVSKCVMTNGALQHVAV